LYLILDDILFQGELKKLITADNKPSRTYTMKFCVIFKTELMIYKSKESFLTLQKPSSVIPLSIIEEAVSVKGYNKNNLKKADHFYLKLNNLETKRVSIRSDLKQSSERRRSSGKETDESIMIFHSDKEDIVNKWVTIINYFVNK
jgi:hypothetical protein